MHPGNPGQVQLPAPQQRDLQHRASDRTAVGPHDPGRSAPADKHGTGAGGRQQLPPQQGRGLVPEPLNALVPAHAVGGRVWRGHR